MTRESNLGVEGSGRPLAPRLLFIAALVSIGGTGHAADQAFGPPHAAAADYQGNGVPRSIGAPFWAPPDATAEDLPWASAWLGIFPAPAPLKMAMDKRASIGRTANSAFPRAKIVKPGSRACVAPIAVPRAFAPVYCCAEWRGCVWRWRTLLNERSGFGETQCSMP